MYHPQILQGQLLVEAERSKSGKSWLGNKFYGAGKFHGHKGAVSRGGMKKSGQKLAARKSVQ